MTILLTSYSFLLLVIGMAAGALLYRWWLSQHKPQVREPSHLIVDESPHATAEKNLELMKKDTQDRKKLKASTPDWGDN